MRQQDEFFVHGVQHLRPLILRDIAAAVEMHESTVSRVTQNKYITTPRGLFELKYFFTTALARSDGGKRYVIGIRARPHPRADRSRKTGRRFCPTTASRKSCAAKASTSPAAPLPNIGKRCALLPRPKDGGRKGMGIKGRVRSIFAKDRAAIYWLRVYWTDEERDSLKSSLPKTIKSVRPCRKICSRCYEKHAANRALWERFIPVCVLFCSLKNYCPYSYSPKNGTMFYSTPVSKRML